MAEAHPIPTNPQFKDLTGQTFGRLTVLSFAGIRRRGKSYWLCECACGAQTIAWGSNLRSGKTRSCGCLLKDYRSKKWRTHGKSNTREYKAWCDMLARCNNRQQRGWRYYGSRGIRVWKGWQSFENFLADMGPTPSYKHSIDRIDNDGDYEPCNCRWATKKEQANNCRSTHWIAFNGKTQPLQIWAEELGICPSMIRKRLKRGWSVERALTTPSRHHQ